METKIVMKTPWLVSVKGLINLRNTLHMIHSVPKGHYIENDEVLIYLRGDDELKQIWIVESVKDDIEDDRDEISIILGWDIQKEPYSDSNPFITRYDA